MEILSYENIKTFINTKYMGRNIVYLQSTTSTNDIIKKMAEDGAKEGLVVIAEEQISGRGRMGRKWITPKGEAIAASILLKPDIPPKIAPTITPLLSLSAVKALRRITGFDIMIKWPNDLVLNKKKLCGILTETTMEGMKIKYIIVGIGININQEKFDDDISNIAISLKSYSGKSFDRRVILGEILNSFEKDYEDFKRYGLKHFINDIKYYSIVLGEKVTVLNIDSVVEGKAVDIDDEGCLIIKTLNGDLKRILSGDIVMEGIYNIYK
ncbi:biotin--[acetyl-CoA-carboxylase] ligase [Caloramator sp. E03]|uniref:biotin--[acetyl-CoA-carboxylase] ligase n=1 Tax=Caloramator sp. E03 TaxID=2576307 RepID=UPI0011102A42|nr:biotin--[acetyl-CoA-carboxylase] ligase [Caloramator sp. E03]QCX33767.1 biotin--[acetyl-CoA-carboxylase] ligase [Caloramator sp. E03]